MIMFFNIIFSGVAFVLIVVQGLQVNIDEFVDKSKFKFKIIKGNGTSSRWHCHYTICDSCYQQRNKGISCPICHKVTIFSYL